MGSHVHEKEKKNSKNLKTKTVEKKWFGDMVDRYLPITFGLDPWTGF